VDDKTLCAALEKRGTDLASKLFDKVTEKGAEMAFDALMVGLATAIGGPADRRRAARPPSRRSATRSSTERLS
jgi:hypothetical protein